MFPEGSLVCLYASLPSCSIGDFMTIKQEEFRQLVGEAFASLCREHGLRISTEEYFVVRLDGPEVFLRVAYHAFGTREVLSSIGLRAGIVHAVERPFQLSELLRAIGQYELPEAQMQEIVAAPEDVQSAVCHLADLYTKYGQDALRGDRTLFSRLNAQRDLDCVRYAKDRRLDDASRAAYVAYARGQYDAVVSLLKPFKERLTADERRMFNAAEAELAKG